MGRPTNRAERRAEILDAFARVLSDHGYAGATIAAVAAEAGVPPGLIHHHFENKEDLIQTLLKDLIARFRQRVRMFEAEVDPLLAYVDGALKLDERSDVAAARCWVGVFSEGMRNPSLFRRLRRFIDLEISTVQERGGNGFGAQQAGAVVAFVIGALVLGAFAPRKTAGFAAPALKQLIAAMRASGAGG